MVDEGSPSRVSNEELIENALILVQQLFAESSINGAERDHIKGMYPHFCIGFIGVSLFYLLTESFDMEQVVNTLSLTAKCLFLLNKRELYVSLDMIFDDDVKLFGLMRRYSDTEEVEELKR